MKERLEAFFQEPNIFHVLPCSFSRSLPNKTTTVATTNSMLDSHRTSLYSSFIMCYRKIETYSCGHRRCSRSPCGRSEHPIISCWLRPSDMEMDYDFECSMCLQGRHWRMKIFVNAAMRTLKTQCYRLDQRWHGYVVYPVTSCLDTQDVDTKLGLCANNGKRMGML
ncbi:hypothetical protein BGZ63DRAFT_75710 [Mariannaea sp. PMI_226]|nr:hypothetical protein BGZ63DRAFT_75710 [Mariannaea sp. PMI_226]